MVKLMMAFNDLTLANEGLTAAKDHHVAKHDDKSRGVAMYFIRLQASHLYEAMKIIDAIANNKRLCNAIDSGSDKARDAFGRLLDIRREDGNKRKFEKFIGRLRNNLTFHYDESEKLIERAMVGRAGNEQGNCTSITRATENHHWRFTIADDVVDSIVCREIWKIPESGDLRAEADTAADYGHQILVDFGDFSAELVARYVRDDI